MSFYFEDGQGSIADEQGKEAMDYEEETDPYNLWNAAASGRKAQVEIRTAQKWAKRLKEDPE
ncbi:hypothetical protein MFLAVUS_008073 [Mucor flavus]|uniref:MHC class I antigen n=1 Tax=Mucor flavus TaxID=439312 RepID=A0ABP9Z665_9FUNG